MKFIIKGSKKVHHKYHYRVIRGHGSRYALVYNNSTRFYTAYKIVEGLDPESVNDSLTEKDLDGYTKRGTYDLEPELYRFEIK